MEEPPFRPEFFARLDEEPDEAFYTMPRKVVHIDEPAIAAIKQGLPEVLPPNGVVLDLLSSWRSHWPEGFPKQRLVGLGAGRAQQRPQRTRRLPEFASTKAHNDRYTLRHSAVTKSGAAGSAVARRLRLPAC